MANEIKVTTIVEDGGSIETLQNLKDKVEAYYESLLDLQRGTEEYNGALVNLLDNLRQINQIDSDVKESISGVTETFGDLIDVTEGLDEWFDELVKDFDEVDSKKTLQNLKDDIQNYTDELVNLDRESHEYKETLIKLAEVQTEINQINSDVEETVLFLTDAYGEAINMASDLLGGFSALADVTKLLGIENGVLSETFARLEAAQKLLASLTALEKGFKSLKVYVNQSSMATKAFNMNLLANPIALIVTAILGLTTYFADLRQEFSFVTDAIDDLWEWIKKLIPSLEGTGSMLDAITQALAGVGTVVVRLLTGPMKALIKLLKGDLTGALDEIKNGFNVVGNFDAGYTNAAEKNAQKRIETLKDENEEIISETKKTNKTLENLNKERREAEEEQYSDILDDQDNGIEDKIQAINDLMDAEKEYEAHQKELIATEEEIALKKEEFEKRLQEVLNPENLSPEEKLQRDLDFYNAEIDRLWEIANDTELSYDQRIEAIEAYNKAVEDSAKTQEAIDKLEKDRLEEKLNATRDVLSSVSEALGEQTVAGKAAAIAAATIDTYKSATSAYASLAPIPLVGPALGAAAAGAAIASGIANVKSILSTKVEGANDTTSASGISSVPSFPEVETPVYETHNNLDQFDEDMLNQSNKVYVTEYDISSTQNKVSVVQAEASY